MYNGFYFIRKAREMVGSHPDRTIITTQENYDYVAKWGLDIWRDLCDIEDLVHELWLFNDDDYVILESTKLLNKEWESPHQLYLKLKEVVMVVQDIMKPKKSSKKFNFKDV